MAEFRVQNCFECFVTVKPHSFVKTIGGIQIEYDSEGEIEYELFLRFRAILSFDDNDSNELRIYRQLRHRYEEDGAPFAFVLDSDDGRIIKIRGYVISRFQDEARDIVGQNIEDVYAYFLDKRKNR